MKKKKVLYVSTHNLETKTESSDLEIIQIQYLIVNGTNVETAFGKNEGSFSIPCQQKVLKKRIRRNV